MTRNQTIDAIHAVLRDHMALPHLESFGPAARLNEDLYLDSVLVMQLFLNLELEFGLVAPEEAISRQDVATVEDFAALFQPAEVEPQAPVAAIPIAANQAAASEVIVGEGVHGEDYVDLKIHCVVSCFCHALKQAPAIDHRPFYFSVWDADFTIGPDFALSYHSATVDHGFFRDWYERLYGVTTQEWYRHDATKIENVATLLALLDRKSPDEWVMVMLDLFHLPERENKFNQNPFPHYLMLEKTADPEIWRVLDPDFRWEGEMARETVIQAISQPTVAGGLVFDRREARVPRDEDLAAYFEACFHPGRNLLTDATRDIVAAHVEGREGVRLGDLGTALRELPVILIRKYAYEHGFAFFWRSLKLPNAGFDVWCDEIETLIQEFRALHYLVVKLSQTQDRSLVAALVAKLDAVDATEFRIKAKMAELFSLWCEARGLAPHRSERALKRGASR